MGTSKRRDVHGGYAAALLAFALLAGCSKQPAAAEPQPAPQDAEAKAVVATGDAPATGDAQVEAVVEDDAAASPSGDKRALRDAYATCLQAAGGVDSAMQDCIGNEYEYQDGRLNTAYAKLKRTLGESQMAGLRTEQRAWIAERDAKCVWDAKTEGSAQRLQANQCRLDATAVRAGELEAILRGGGAGGAGGAGGGAAEAKTRIEANAALESGRMTLSAGDMRFTLTAPSCRPVSDGLSVCEGNVQLIATPADGASQTLRPAALYLNQRATLYRGAVAQRDRRASQSIIVSDVNGDGRDDLALWTGTRGGYGGASYDIYLFDATKKTFVRSAAFSELTVGRDGFFTIVDGRIRTTSKSGCCLHTEEFHVVEKNAPKLVERIVEDATGNRAAPTRTVSKLVDGRMREVKE